MTQTADANPWDDPHFQRDLALYLFHGAVDELYKAIEESQLFDITDKDQAKRELQSRFVKRAGTVVRSLANDGPILRDTAKQAARLTLGMFLDNPSDMLVKGLHATSAEEDIAARIKDQAMLKALRNHVFDQIIDDLFNQWRDDWNSVKAQFRDFIKVEPKQEPILQPPPMPVPAVQAVQASPAPSTQDAIKMPGCLGWIIAIVLFNLGNKVHWGFFVALGILALMYLGGGIKFED